MEATFRSSVRRAEYQYDFLSGFTVSHLTLLILSLPNASLKALRDDPDHVGSKFWTDECQVARAQVRCHRLLRPTLWATLASINLRVWFIRGHVLDFVLGYLDLCALLIKSVAKLRTAPKQRQTRKENQEKLSRRGFYWETRSVYEPFWLGIHKVRYFYLFPPKSDHLDCYGDFDAPIEDRDQSIRQVRSLAR
jgi:hypothetical protein